MHKGFTISVVGSHGENPGLHMRLSQSGLDYGLKVGVDVLSAQLSGCHLPDVNGSKDIEIGYVTYGLSGMIVSSFEPPEGSISVLPGEGLSVRLAGANISVDGDWNYTVETFITVRDHGTFEVTATDISVTLAFSLGKTSSGKPDIWSTFCSSSVSTVGVTFHGGASWLYNLSAEAMEEPIKGAINRLVCKEARDAVDVSARKYLSTMPTFISIRHLVDFDYSLVQNPEFKSGYLQSAHKGEFFWHGHKTEAPFSPGQLPDPHQTSGMVQLHVSPYIGNTLGYVLHQLGFLQHTLTRHELPADDQAILNTTCSTICIGKFIPQLEKFPGKNVKISMKATSDPKVTVIPNKVLLNFLGSFQYDLDLDLSTQYLFTSSINATVEGTGKFEGSKITGSIYNIETDQKVTNSNIGEVSSESLNVMFDAASIFILPKLNEYVKKGLKIPTIKDVQFQNAETKLFKDVIFVSTDVYYQPDTTLYFEPA